MRRRFFVLLEGRKPEILEKLVKALFEWLASLWYEMVEYLLDQLMELFNVDLSYFAERVPVIDCLLYTSGLHRDLYGKQDTGPAGA